uniref:Reverse transcriptase zinc-binding domain-containing protein n=1 Tax=Rhodnius prolixus TaxID=13249 RepID=T1HLY6_RHOPR
MVPSLVFSTIILVILLTDNCRVSGVLHPPGSLPTTICDLPYCSCDQKVYCRCTEPMQIQNELFHSQGIRFDVGAVNPEALNNSFIKLRKQIGLKFLEDCVNAATSSKTSVIYKDLKYDLNFINEWPSINDLTWIIKARGELISLNYKRYETSASSLCSLCNLSQQEDIYHFIAICPILKEFRVKWLKKAVLTREELINYLNGADFKALINYCKTAWQYRYFLVQEFNY